MPRLTCARFAWCLILLLLANVQGYLIAHDRVALTAVANATQLAVTNGWDTRADPCCGEATSYTMDLPWNGVTCAPANCSLPQRVTGLYAYVVGPVGGYLPAQIGELTALTSIIIGCGLTGDIPTQIGMLTNLTILDLSSNNLEDEPPNSIEQLTQLTHINLCGNFLCGDLHFLKELPNLISIEVSNNDFWGFFPNLTSNRVLDYIDISDNLIGGTIPDFLGTDFPALASVDLASNCFDGTIPATLFSHTKLGTVDLSGNYLTGTIPDMSALTRLKEIYLQNNRLSGCLPDSLWNLKELDLMDFSNNPQMNTNLTAELHIAFTNKGFTFYATNCGLTGGLPHALMTPFVYQLVVSGNSLGGKLPLCHNVSTHSYQLNTLDLSNNDFSGSIPDCYSLLEGLVSLQLGGNHLTGSIPASLAELKTLQILDLSNNKLTGAIPNLVGDQSKLEFLAVGNNPLVSPPPVLAYFYPAMETFNSPIEYLDIEGVDLQGVDFKEALETMFGLTSCVYGALAAPPAMQTLYMPRANVTGSLPSLLYCLLPSLTSLTLTNNNLTGTIPKVALPYFLQMFDLSNNQLTGPLPAALGEAFKAGLYSLNVEGNMLRGVNHTLPNFLTYTWSFQVENGTGNYVCPGIINIETTSHIFLDPAYYQYSLCNCSFGYHGSVFYGCRPNVELCQPAAPYCVNQSAVVNQGVSIAAGYAPSPNNSYVTAFLPCVPIGTVNPTAGCTQSCACSIGRGDAINCSSCNVCSPGYGNRLCGLCEDGYYHLNMLCLPCEGSVTGYGWVTIACAVFFVFSSITVAVCLNEVDLTPRVRLLVSSPSLNSTANGAAAALESPPPGTPPVLGATNDHDSVRSSTYVKDDPAGVSHQLMGKPKPSKLPVDSNLCGRKGNGLGIVIALTVLDIGIMTVLIMFHQVALWQIELMSLLGINAILFVVVWQQMGYRRARPEDPPLTYDTSTSGQASLFQNQPLSSEQSSLDKGLLKIFLFYLQLSFALMPLSLLTAPAVSLAATVGTQTVGPTVTIKNPNVVKEIFDALQMVVQLHPAGLDCILDLPPQTKYVAKSFVIAMMPVIFVIITFMTYWLRRLTMRKLQGEENHRRQKAVLFGRATSTGLFIFYLIFFSIITSALTILNCEADPTPGVSAYWVVTLPYVQCYVAGEWQWAALANYLPLSIYVFVVLAVIRYLFVRRHSLQEHAEMASFGFIYSSYKPHVWWFELVILVRRVILAILLSMITNTSPFRQQMIITVLLVALVTQVHVRPYRMPLANTMETASLVMVTLSYLASISIQQSDTALYEYLGVNTLRILVIVFNSIFIIFFLGVLASRALKKLWSGICCKKKDDMALKSVTEREEEEALLGERPRNRRTVDADEADARVLRLQQSLDALQVRLAATVRDKDAIIADLRARVVRMDRIKE